MKAPDTIDRAIRRDGKRAWPIRRRARWARLGVERASHGGRSDLAELDSASPRVGKVTHLGVGSYPVVTLAMARKAALANKRAVAEGKDPRAGGIPTFADALDKVIAIQRDAWRDGGKSERQWRASLRDYAEVLMPKAVDAIGPGDVLGVLSPIWNTRRETGRRVKQRIGAVRVVDRRSPSRE